MGSARHDAEERQTTPEAVFVLVYLHNRSVAGRRLNSVLAAKTGRVLPPKMLC
jgi:hypothetical protein